MLTFIHDFSLVLLNSFQTFLDILTSLSYFLFLTDNNCDIDKDDDNLALAAINPTHLSFNKTNLTLVNAAMTAGPDKN